MKIKDIALSAAYVGQMVVKAICVGAQEVWSAVKYIVFKDPVVEQICATNWGDGVGITEEQAAKVTSIGTLFKGNTEITSFDELEEFSNVSTLSNNAFDGCTNLTRCTLPPDVTELPNYAFRGCAQLSMDLRQIKEIKAHVFEGALTGDVVLDNIGKIGYRALWKSNIVSLIINHPISYYYEAIRECLNLKRVIIGRNYYPTMTFTGCTNLSYVDITDNRTVTSLTRDAFTKTPLSEVVDIRLPNQKSTKAEMWFQIFYSESISDFGRIDGVFSQAISYGYNLKYVAIPYGVTTFSWNWSGCNALKTMVFNPIIPIAVTGGSSSPNSVTAIYVPDESVQMYKETAPWTNVASKIFPMSDYVAYEDITSQLVSDVVYATPTEAYAKFNNAPISEVGAKSLICDVSDYGFLRISGTGGTTSRLYCFLDENDEVVTTSDESLAASPLYIIIPKIATKMVVNLSAASSAMKVEIGKHVEQ